MYISKEEREDYERRFNGYIMRIIKNQYVTYLKHNKNRELSLNVLNQDGEEFIDLIVDDDDIYSCDDFEIFVQSGNLPFKYNELEILFEDVRVYNAVKSLTDKEKLAIFLCQVLQMDKQEMAKELGVKYGDSAMRIYRKAIRKVKNNLLRNGGNKNDWLFYH